MPFCVNCGSKIELEYANCPNCGNVIKKNEIVQTKKEADKKEENALYIPVANRTKRFLAASIDLSIGIGLSVLAYAFMVERIALTGTKIRWMIIRALLPFLPAIYLLFRDSLGGKSFGKLILGLTTINLDKRKPAGLTDSLLRNALLAIVAIPILGWIAFLALTISIGVQIILGRTKRIGDEFAKTIVVDDRNLDFL